MAALLGDLAQHLEAAVRFGAAAEQVRHEGNITLAEEQPATFAHTADLLRQQLGEAAFDRLWQEGRTTPLSQIVRAATTLLTMKRSSTRSSTKPCDVSVTLTDYPVS